MMSAIIDDDTKVVTATFDRALTADPALVPGYWACYYENRRRTSDSASAAGSVVQVPTSFGDGHVHADTFEYAGEVGLLRDSDGALVGPQGPIAMGHT